MGEGRSFSRSFQDKTAPKIKNNGGPLVGHRQVRAKLDRLEEKGFKRGDKPEETVEAEEEEEEEEEMALYARIHIRSPFPPCSVLSPLPVPSDPPVRPTRDPVHHPCLSYA